MGADGKPIVHPSQQPYDKEGRLPGEEGYNPGDVTEVTETEVEQNYEDIHGEGSWDPNVDPKNKDHPQNKFRQQQIEDSRIQGHWNNYNGHLSEKEFKEEFRSDFV